MGGTIEHGIDPAALLLVVLVVAGVLALVGISAYRRRGKLPLLPGLRKVRKRMDVIRRDLDRMADSVGEFAASDPAFRESFELGLAAIAGYHWNQAIDHLAKAGSKADRAQLVHVLNKTGVCHYMQGSPGRALREFTESARLAEREGDKQGRASALNNIAVVLHDNGEPSKALRELRSALTVARESGDERVVAICLGNIGNVQRERGELDDAMIAHEQSLAIAHRIADRQGIAGELGNIASVRRDKGEFDKALEQYAEAVEVAREIGYNLGYAVELGSIGGVYHDKGDLDRALKFHEDALAGSREIGYRAGVATELGNIGLILVRQGGHERAVSYLTEALSVLLSTGVIHGQIQTLLGLSSCDDSLGRGRMVELLRDSGLKDDGAADVLDRVDQIRKRRPWRRGV